MQRIREWLRRLAGTVGPARSDADLDEELRLHLDLVAEEARRRGHDPADAVRLARLQAGAPAQALEAMRDQRGLPWLDDLARDTAYGWRALRRRPGFAATAMLSLALGIGANTGIFSLVDQLLFRALPVREPDRLVLLDWVGPTLPSTQYGDQSLMPYPLCRELAGRREQFEGVFCRHPGIVNVSIGGGTYQRLRAEVVSGTYFDVLGIRPAAGRLIGPSDDVQPGRHPVVVIAHDYWQRSLGAAPDIVGRPVLVNNHPMTVVGVAAEGFRGVDAAAAPALWIPAMMAREATVEFGRILDRRAFWLNAFARLAPGVDAEAAERGIQPWFSSVLVNETRTDGFPRVTPEVHRAYLASTLALRPAGSGFSPLRSTHAQPMQLLLLGTALLLLLACLNVASLLLARGAERSQELITRLALGASRGRLTRQLMAESLLIALAGGLLGLLAAGPVARLMLLFLPEGTTLTPAVDGRIVVFTFLIALAAGTLCGTAPAFQIAKRPLAASLNGRASAGAAGVRLRKLIVGAQLALTLVLLIAAGLFVQTLASLYTRDRGYDSEQLVMFRAEASGASSRPDDAPRVMRDLQQALRQVPAVERVAIGNIGLLGALGPSRVLTLDTVPRTVLQRPLPMMRVGAGFFATLGARVLDGREFDERDILALEQAGLRAIVVNEAFARRFYDGTSPVGRRVGIGNLPDTPLDVEIVGVVADFRRRFMRDDDQPEHIFIPFAATGTGAGDGTIYVRVRGEATAAFGAIRTAAATVDPRLPLVNLTTVEDQIARSLRSEAMLATLSGGFGTVALVLSVIGLFGVMSFVVTQRTQEIGMRMALGATRTGAMWLIVREALVTIGAGAGVGIAVGVAAGVVAAPWLTTVLHGVTPADITTLAGATVGLAGVSLAACIVPSGRAAMLSPMVAMREQPESIWRSARRRVRQAVRDIAVPRDLPAAGAATLAADIGGAIRGSDSFADAVTVALATLRERVGARSILLLERQDDAYRASGCVVPADGVLVNRLQHYPNPLPVTAADLEAWGRWAREMRPAHGAEIAQLAERGVRMAVPLRSHHDLVGILLLGAPEGTEDFGEVERQLLGGAAAVFALLIENARLSARALEQEKLRRDLALASEVQRRLLPSRPPACAGATFAAFTLPARTVGGDYYDFLEQGEDRIAVAVADIAGKGIPAALLMSSVQASLRLLAGRDVPSAQLAAQLNHQLHQSTATSSYATFFYAQLDLRNRRLCYVNAGHNPPYLVRRAGASVELMKLTVGGMVIGLFPGASYEDGHLELAPGDVLVAFTDGVTEARNAGGEEFGEEQLEAFLRDSSDLPPDALAARLTACLRAWMAGAEQHDDVTFVIAAVSENPAPA